MPFLHPLCISPLLCFLLSHFCELYILLKLSLFFLVLWFFSSVVILVPTRELALQTSQVCKELGKYLNIQVMVSTGGTSLKDDIMRLYQPVHLLVGTPGRILDLTRKGICVLKDCSMLVMDEVWRGTRVILFMCFICIFCNRSVGTGSVFYWQNLLRPIWLRLIMSVYWNCILAERKENGIAFCIYFHLVHCGINHPFYVLDTNHMHILIPC